MNKAIFLIVILPFPGVELATEESSVMSASLTRDVNMVPAVLPGSATARRAGEVSSVTKVSVLCLHCNCQSVSLSYY